MTTQSYGWNLQRLQRSRDSNGQRYRMTTRCGLSGRVSGEPASTQLQRRSAFVQTIYQVRL